MPGTLLHRPRQHYVFVTKTDAATLTSEDHRQIRQQAQLTRWGSNTLDAVEKEHKRSRGRGAAKTAGAFHDFRIRNKASPAPSSSSPLSNRDDSATPKSAVSAHSPLSTGSASTAVTIPSVSPVSMLNSSEPFDAKPACDIPGANELIYQYVNDMGPAVGESRVRQIAADYRRTIWMPLAIKERGAYFALLSFLFAAPRSPDRLRSDAASRQCLAMALKLVRDQISTGETGDVMIFSIGMLELTSYVTGDLEARLRHHNGLKALLAARKNMAIHLKSFADSTEREAATIKHPAQTELAFKEMHELGIISNNLAEPFRWLKGQQDYTTLVSRDMKVGVFFMGHAPLCTRAEPVPLTTYRPDLIYHACHATLASTSWMMYNEGHFKCWKVEGNVRSSHAILFRQGVWQYELIKLWKRYPSVLLWMSLILGTGTSMEARRDDFTWVVIETRRIMGLRSWDEATQVMTHYYRWPENFNRICKYVWDRADGLDDRLRPQSKLSNDASPSFYSEARVNFLKYLEQRGITWPTDLALIEQTLDFERATTPPDDEDYIDVAIDSAAPRIKGSPPRSARIPDWPIRQSHHIVP